MYIRFYRKSLESYYRLYNIFENWDDPKYHDTMVVLLTNFQRLLLHWERLLRDDFNDHPWSIRRFKNYRRFNIATDEMFDNLNRLLSEQSKNIQQAKKLSSKCVVKGFK